MTNPRWASRRAWLGAAAATVAAAGVGAWVWRGMAQSSAAQAAFWERKFQGADGREMRMSDFKAKPLVLNFWATWCPPCLEELPLLESFFLQNQSNGWQVLGLAADRDASVRRFLARMPLSYPVGLTDNKGVELSQSLGNDGGGLPFTIFFDAGGRLMRHKIGRLDADDLKSWASALKP